MTHPDAKEEVRKQAEFNRLLHKRKSISGSEFAGVGMQFALTIVAFALAGVWMDKRLGSSPWFVLLMVFGGAALGFWSMYRRVMAGGRQSRNEDMERR